MRRRGLGAGRGKGYHNLIPHDRPVHRDSGRGIKQPQQVPIGRISYGWKDIAPFKKGGLGDKVYVKRDGKILATLKSEDEAFVWILKHQPNSVSYATKHGGYSIEKSKEKIVGGLGDNRPDSDFDPKELRKGIKVEMEHTKDPKIAKEIAKDHISEFPRGGYYENLDKMEKNLKQPKTERWESGGLYTVQSFAFDTPDLKKTMNQQQMVRFAKESLKLDRRNGQDVAGIRITDLNNPLNAWVYLKNMGYAVGQFIKGEHQ
jgi:hypothetical protein